MKKRVVAASAVLLLVTTAAAAQAQDRGTALGGIEFGSHPKEVAATLIGLGLKISPKPQDKRFPFDQTFEGQLNGRAVRVTAWFDPQASLEKMSVVFLTGDKDCLDFYRRFKQFLISEYGQTRVDLEHWKDPYNDGYHVGHEETAIRSDKAFIAATWDTLDAGSLEGGVALSVSNDLTVLLSFESSRWSSEADRRKKVLNDGP
jgi:hypothetical protein